MQRGYPGSNSPRARPSRRSGPVAAGAAAAAAIGTRALPAAVPIPPWFARFSPWLLGAWAVYELYRWTQTFVEPRGAGWYIVSDCTPPARATFIRRAVHYSTTLSFAGQCLNQQALGLNAYSAASRTAVLVNEWLWAGAFLRYDFVRVYHRTSAESRSYVPPYIGQFPPINAPIRMPDAVVPASPVDAVDANPFKPALPWRVIPNVRSIPLTRQTRQSGYSPGVRTPTYRADIVFPLIPVRPGTRPVRAGRTLAAPRTIPRAAAQAGPAEQKVQAPASFAIWRGLGWWSEMNDLVDAFYKGVPSTIKAQHSRYIGGRTMAVMQAIREGSMQWDVALAWAAANQFTDAAVGGSIGVQRSMTDAFDRSGNLWRTVNTFT